MGTRIKIKRGTENSIVANKDSLERYEIVYATDSGRLGIREYGTYLSLDTEDGIVWFIPKDTYYIEMGKGAYSEGYSGIAIGENAYAGEKGIAIGGGASTAINEIAIGIAIGIQAKVKTSADGGVAIGKAAEINAGASKSIAIGQNAKANTSNTIQLGENAVDFTLNVGNKKASLIGDYTSYSATSSELSLTFNQIFGDNAPIGTIAEMIITTLNATVTVLSQNLLVKPQFIDIKKDSSLFFEVNNGASTPIDPSLTPIKLILFKNATNSAIILECDKLRNLNETYTETTKLTSTSTIKLKSYGYRKTATGEPDPYDSYHEGNTKTTVYIKRR